MSDILEILIEGKLDQSQSSIKSLKEQIKSINKSLNDEKIEINLGLNGEDLKKLDQQTEQIKEALKQLSSESAFQKIKDELTKTILESKEFSKSLADIEKQTNILKSSTKFDMLNGVTTHTQEIQKDLLSIEKITQSFNEKGELIKNTQEHTLGYLDAQKEVYDDLTKSLAKINALEKEKLQASDETKATIDYEISKQKELAKTISKTLDDYGLRNDKMEQEIKSAQKLKEIQQSIRGEKTDEGKTNRAYSELVKAMKEEGRIASQMVGTQDELNDKYGDRLKIATSLRMEIEKQIAQEGLTNSEKEVMIKREIERINSNIAIQEQKGLDKETLRVKKLNDRLGSLQEILKKEEGNIDIKSNKDDLLEQIKSMEEFARSTARGKTQILSYKETIDSLGNVQAKVNVQTDEGRGLVKQHSLVIDQATQSIYKLSERTKEASNRQLGYAESLGVAMKRSIQWALTTKLVAMSFNYLRDSVKHVMEMNKQLNQVQMVTRMTKQQVDELGESYYKLGARLSKVASEIAVVNTDLIRQGLSSSEAMNRLETTLKFSATASIDTQHALSIVTSGVNALGVEAEDLIDVLLKAGNITASSAEQIGDALTRVASSARSTGTSIEEVTAIMSTLIEVTQESPSSLGNSLKTLMARFNKVNEETGEFNASINETQKAFESVGIKFTDANGQIKPFYDLLSELNSVWKDLDGNTKSYIATASAGANQRNRFLAIMENFNKVQSNHNELLNSEGTLTESYGIYVDSLEAKLNKLKNTLQEGMTKIVDSDIVKALLIVLDSIAQLVINTDAFGITLGHVAVTMLAFNKGLDLFNSRSLGTVTILGKTINGFGDLAVAIQDNGGVVKTFGTLLTSLKNRTNEVSVANTTGATTTKLFSASMDKATISTHLLSTGLALMSSIGVMLLITALAKLVNYIATANKRLEELATNVKANVREHEKNIKSLEAMGDEFETLQKKMHGYGDTLKLTEEEERRYYEISSMIADFAPEVVQSYDDKEQAIIRYGTAIDDLVDKEKTLIDLENYKLLKKKDSFQMKVDDQVRHAGFKQRNNDRSIEQIRKEIADIEKSYDEKIAQNQNPANEIAQLEQKRVKLSDLIMKQKQYTAEIQEAVKEYEPIIQVYTKEIEAIDGVDESLANLIKTINMSKFEEDYFNSAKSEEILTKTKVAIEDFTKATKGVDTSQFTKELMNVGNELIKIGYNGKEADEILFQMAQTGLGLEDMAKALEGVDLSINVDGIKEATKEINNLSSAYKQLASGQKLSAEQLIDLITNYEEIANVINEQGELNASNMDVFLEIMDKVHQSRLDELVDMQKNNLAQRELTITTLEHYETLLGFLASAGLVGGRLYDYVSKQIEKHKGELTSLEKKYASLEAQSKALNTVMGQTFHNQKLEDYQSVVTSTSSSIKDLNGLLEDMNKQKRITSETADAIIQKYPELAFYLDNEVVLRQKIIEKINEETETRDRSFKDMLSMSDGFATAFYNKHSTLFSQVAEIYNEDLRAFATANEKKMALMNAMMQEIPKAGQVLISEMGGGLKGQISYYEGLLKQQTGGNGIGAMTPKQASQYGLGLSNQKVSEIQTQLDFLRAQEQMLEGFKTPNLSSFKPASKGSKKSKSSKQIIEEVKLLTDEYKKFEKALNEVNRALGETQALSELATGKDKIKLLEQQNNLIREQQRLTNLRANAERKERDEIAKGLGERGINLSDGTMGLDSFAGYTKAIESSINAVVRNINATSNDKLRENLTKQKDDMQKTYDKVKEDFDRYIELKDSIPDLSAEWWALEYEALTTMLEAVDIRYEDYNKQIDYLSSSMTYMLGIREDNVEELAKEKEVMGQISQIYKTVLKDIETQSDESAKRVALLEKTLSEIGDKQSAQYQATSRQLILARAERDKYFEQYKSHLDKLASHQTALINNYNSEVERARDKSIKAIDDIRKSFKGFDESGFINALEKIIVELDFLDNIFMSNAQTNLSTSSVRKDIQGWKEDIIDTVGSLKDLEKEIEKIGKKEAKSQKESEKKQQMLIDKALEQVELENELKDLERELSEEIANRELENKKIEASLENQIKLKQEEVEKIKKQAEYEDKIRAMKEKQLELLRAMDDTRFVYITGKGEATYTFDQDKVLQLQKELADMQRKEEEESEVERIEKEVSKMQEELSKTKEINKQELEVLKVAQKGISELVSLSGKNIESTKETINQAYEQMSDLFATEIKEAMKEYTANYQNYWDEKISGVVAEFSSLTREINKGKLGGVAGEKYGTNAQGSFKPSEFGNEVTKAIDKGNNNGVTALTTYTAQAGETLESIAQKFKTSVDKLMSLNLKYLNGGSVASGDSLVVPDRFDTGGYTGSWGTNPKLALVDSKELILKDGDTKNFLDAISLARKVVEEENEKKYKETNLEGKTIVKENYYDFRNSEFNEVEDVQDFYNEMYGLGRDSTRNG